MSSFFSLTGKKSYSGAEIWNHVMGKDFRPWRGSYKYNSKRYTFSKLFLPLCEIKYLQIMQTFSIKKPLYFVTQIINQYLLLVCSVS